MLNALKGFLGVLRLCSLKKFTESWEIQTKMVPNKEINATIRKYRKNYTILLEGGFCGGKNSPRWAIRED